MVSLHLNQLVSDGKGLIHFRGEKDTSTSTIEFRPVENEDSNQPVYPTAFEPSDS